jgi:hypothetical protein
MMRRCRPRAIPAVLLAVGLASCSGGSAPPAGQKPVFPVRGQVFVGDKPAVGAFVLFVPVGEPADPIDPRPRAEVQADGSFQLSTYGDNDGAPAGEYVVVVTWTVEDQDRLQGRYADPGRSKLRATVKEGANELQPFRLK